MKIIGITGTLGAGKGTIVDYLVQSKGYAHYSVRSFLIERLTQLRKEVNRDTMVELANSLREQHSPSYIIEILYDLASAKGKNCIIESIRTKGEIEMLRQKENFILLAIDAQPEIRYERIRLRDSETDRISFEIFIENEMREMNSEDKNKQNLSACIASADVRIDNNGSKQELIDKIEELIKQNKI